MVGSLQQATQTAAVSRAAHHPGAADSVGWESDLLAAVQERLRRRRSRRSRAGLFLIAGALEPAADVGGDTFGYTLKGTASACP